MTAETDRPDFKSPVDLAREADFALGASRVSPSSREVLRGTDHEMLEPRVMQVLVALFQANGRVMSRDELIARCWDGHIVGEDAINRAIGRLRRLSEVDRGASFVIETVARVGYRLTASRPLVAAGAGPAGGSPAAKPKNGPVKLMAAAAIAVAAVAAAALFWIYSRPAPVPVQPVVARIAVLPFDTLSGNDDARIFGKTVAEQIITTLNDVQVQTVSREDAVAISGTDRDAVAVKLGAEFILSGSVQSGGKGLHVIVHLDHALTHATVWTKSYDQNGAAALEFQTQVAAVASDIARRALSARRDDPGEMDDAALGIDLKMAAEEHTMTQETLLGVRDLARELIVRAPKYAMAYSTLAVVSGLLLNSARPDDAAVLRVDAKNAASQTLALDHKSGSAYLALALLVPNGKWAEQEATYRKGLSVAPNDATLQNYLARVLASVGRMQESLAWVTTSQMLDPQSPPKNASLGTAQVETGHVAEGISTINRAAKIWPSDAQVWTSRFYILANFGQEDEARAMLDSAQDIPVSLESGSIAARRAYLDALRLNTPAIKIAARNAIRLAVATGDVSSAQGMQMFAKLGDLDTAFTLARMVFAPQDSRQVRASTAPLFQSVTDSMRRDPRFMPLAAQAGLVDYWEKTGKWPDFCSQPLLPYDCRAAAAALSPPAVLAHSGH